MRYVGSAPAVAPPPAVAATSGVGPGTTHALELAMVEGPAGRLVHLAPKWASSKLAPDRRVRRTLARLAAYPPLPARVTAHRLASAHELDEAALMLR